MIEELVVREARLWLGTPYRHQAATKGAGCDCLGLLRGVWEAIYGDQPLVPPYSADWDEVSRRDVLLQAARSHFDEVERSEPVAGDVLLFRMRKGAVAKHLGICSEPGRFIHSYNGHGVVENALTPPWLRRVVGIFAFPIR